MNTLTLSIVSHGQCALVEKLLQSLVDNKIEPHEIIITLNIPEEIPDIFSHLPLSLTFIHNTHPKGFGENHNAAFKQSTGEFFCVLNPDILLTQNPFPTLMHAFEKEKTGVAAPHIVDEKGIIQDSAREFLTLPRLFKRVFSKTTTSLSHPDWVAGMFMVFTRDSYTAVNGFDEQYFLYCEDMDICLRLTQKGYSIALLRDVSAIHTAQRQSHRDFRYLLWHIKSLCRYLWKTRSIDVKISSP